MECRSFRLYLGRLHKKAETGFSTIEAMVAIAILSLALVPLYSFQGSIMKGSARVQQTLDATAVSRMTDTFLRGLTPSALQTGAATIGELDITWTLTDLQLERDALTASGFPGRFLVKMLRVDFEVSQSNRLVSIGSLNRLSWQETGPFLSDLDG